MNYRIISDTHFLDPFPVNCGDRKKGFEKSLYKSLSTIPVNDVLIHIGDIARGNAKDILVHKTYIEPLKCTKILVRGNHDNKSDAWYIDHWRDFVCDELTIKKYNKILRFIHIPTAETNEWAEVFLDRYVIHWHYHTHRRNPNRITRHRLCSCEYSKMQVQKLETVVSILDIPQGYLWQNLKEERTL